MPDTVDTLILDLLEWMGRTTSGRTASLRPTDGRQRIERASASRKCDRKTCGLIEFAP